MHGESVLDLRRLVSIKSNYIHCFNALVSFVSIRRFRHEFEGDLAPFINSELLSLLVPGLPRKYVYDPPFQLKFQQVILVDQSLSKL